MGQTAGISQKPQASILEESKKSINTTTLLRGTLRKKGLIFLNERTVTIDSKGILNYCNLDKQGVIKGTIDMASSQLQSVRFVYAGAQPAGSTQARPAKNIDDEFRITLNNRESFIFRSSKV